MKKNKQLPLATRKYIRISPTKISKILSKIRGKSYKDCLILLKSFPQKPGAVVWQTLYSAVSNAENNFFLNKNSLVIAEAFVNKANILKKNRCVAKGKVFKIEKKYSHLTIKVFEPE